MPFLRNTLKGYLNINVLHIGGEVSTAQIPLGLGVFPVKYLPWLYG